jgi:hypothetical protein
MTRRGVPEPNVVDPVPDPGEPVDRAAQGSFPVGSAGERRSWREVGAAQVSRVVRAIREADEATVEDAVLRLSRTRRLLAPLAVVVGAFASLFEGLKLLVSNWRLTVVQLLPAIWIWLAMVDLKAHVLHGRSFTIVTGPLLLLAMILIAAITAASFFLNAVFAFAIAAPGTPDTRRGRELAWAHRGVVLAWGTGIGVLLALATVVVGRWGTQWFTLCLGIVVGVMMVCYVAVPSRLIGVPKSTMSRRDRVAAAIVGGAIGAVVCTPPYVLARIGLLMLGSQLLLVPGVILLVIGLMLQAGAAGSVKAVKLSATLVASRRPDAEAVPGKSGPITPNG